MKAKELQHLNFSCFNTIKDPILVLDFTGDIVYFNVNAGEALNIRTNNNITLKIDEYLFPPKNFNSFKETIDEIKSKNISKTTIETKSKAIPYIEFEGNISIFEREDSSSSNVLLVLTNKSESNSTSVKIEKINSLLKDLNDNYEESINKLTSLAGELLGATCAIYNRLDSKKMLCSIGQWNTPSDYKSVDLPDGHICYDVIKKESDEVQYIPNLINSTYYTSDVNVTKYSLKTYIGRKVRCNGNAVGSLCVVYNTPYDCTPTDVNLLGLLSLAIENVETRESLKKSKEKYENLFNYASEGILNLNEEFKITEINQCVTTLTGYEQSELIGKNITFLIELDNKNKKNTGQEENILNLIFHNSVKIKHKDGSTVKVEIQSRLMADNCYQTMIINVKEQNTEGTRLTFSNNLYQGVFNKLTDSVYILDKNSKFLDVNGSAEKMYGFKRNEFIGNTPQFLSAPGLNDLEKTVEHIKNAYNGANIIFEFWSLRRDGSIFPKEVSLSPGYWFGQKVVIALGRDISGRKAAEEKLKISEEKYRLLVQYSSDPIFSFNSDDSYRFVNEAFAQAFGKTPEEIIGNTPYSIFPKEEAEKRLKLIHNVFATAKKGEIEVKVINTKNETKYYLTLADPILDHDGKVLWVTCISKDITARKQAEEELRQKNEQLKETNAEKDKIFSIVAHDLRGPMNGFLGLTGIMVEDIESLSANELKEIANTMRTSAVNIYRLIENLLEWSRLQRGVIHFEPQPMFLKSALSKSIEIVKDSANKKEIQIEISIPEHMVVNADLHMLETIIRNLVSNAIKFSPRGSTVSIKAYKTEAKMICIEVEDQGIGIPDDLTKKLFSISENTSRKGTENEPSTGLGLILCKEFVEHQGGKISVISEVGKGSRFSITVPQL